MEKFLLKFLLVISLLILNACAGIEEDDISGIDSNIAIANTFTTHDSTKIEGSGTVRFSESLPNISSRSLALKASLDSTIALSSITVVLYSADAAIPLNRGVAITFNRAGAGITAEIRVNGTSTSVNSSKLLYYFPTALDLVIDVHNINNKARVLIWRRNMVEYSPTTADVDSDRSGDLSASLSQVGDGSFVGLILQNATITAARLGTQKVLD